MKMKRAAFTIIELLVVISIIALLIAILLPSLAGARDRARFIKWAGFSHSLRIDPRFVTYYDMQTQKIGDTTDDEMVNRASVDPFLAAKHDLEPNMFNMPMQNVNWTNSGRWKGMPALDTNGVEASPTAMHGFHDDLPDALNYKAYTVMISFLPRQDNNSWTGLLGKPGRHGSAFIGSSNSATNIFIHHRFATQNVGGGGGSTNDGTGNTPSGTIKMDEWNHLVMTNEGHGGFARTYVRGKEAATPKNMASLELRGTDRELIIGSNLDNKTNTNGKPNVLVDEIAIFNEAWDVDEVTAAASVGQRRSVK